MNSSFTKACALRLTSTFGGGVQVKIRVDPAMSDQNLFSLTHTLLFEAANAPITLR